MLPIVAIFKTPLGLFEVTFDEQHVFSANFTDLQRNPSCSAQSDIEPNTCTQPESIPPAVQPFYQYIKEELNAYFTHPQHRLQIPLKPAGTSFQLHIWHSLLVIPAGRTITYGELALRMQTSPRAVGQACKKNPLPLFIPCHRVVGKNDYGGYMGSKTALQHKLALLKHEGCLA